MNKIKLILLSLLVFLLINIIIVICWPIKVNLAYSNYSHYSENFLKSLKLSKKEGLKLYLETWQRDRLYEYDEYTGIKESESLSGKFVNITDKNGRLVLDNPEECSKNVFFYGGENVFGYDLPDNKTIPNFFSNLLKKNSNKYCVYNFGRGTYFSTQENILFQKHILKNRFKKNDLIIFIDGENEKGNQELLNTEFIVRNYNELHAKYWKLYKVGFQHFFSLLPVTQFYQVLKGKINIKKNKDNNEKNIVNKDREKEILSVYKNNLKIRKAICKDYKLRCHNFLLMTDPLSKSKYNKLKTLEGVYDLTKDFTLEKNSHGLFTHNANQIISKEIYEFIFN